MSLIATIHAGLRWLCPALQAPAVLLGPLGGLVLVSAASGIAILIVFRYASSPARVRAARRGVQAELLAIRIYRHDLGIVMRSELRLCLALGRYVATLARPLAVMLVPFAVLFAHLDAAYARRALRPGEQAVVRAVVDPATVDSWELHGGSGLDVDSVAVRIPSRGEIAWRIRTGVEGTHSVRLVAGNRVVEKRVEVSERARGAPARRAASSVEALFLAPSEPAIDRAIGVFEVDVAYPRLELQLGAWRLHWVMVFLGTSSVAALALRRRARVEL